MTNLVPTVAPSEVDGSITPIFTEDNKEFVMEYLGMCQSRQVVIVVCLHVPHTKQVFARKS